MTRLYLVRHGRTIWNLEGKYQGQSDTPLSEEGIFQAKCLAEAFPAETLDAVYASDLQRAHDTASAVAEKFHLAVQDEPAFRELHFGDWEGLTYEEIVATWPDALHTFFMRPDLLQIPHGESFQTLQTRAVTCLNALLKEHEGQSFAIFAHGAILRTILADVLGMPLSHVWRIRQSNTAVNILQFNDGFPTVELLNDTSHLRGNASMQHEV